MECGTLRPDRSSFKSGDTALRQRREPGVKLLIEPTPCRLVAPFDMSLVSATVVSEHVVPRDPECSIRACEGTEKSKF